MLHFLARRAISMIFILLLISFVVYGLVNLMPGDPLDIEASTNPRMTPEALRFLKEQEGLNDGFMVRYGRWLGDAVKGNFGYGRRPRKPVTELVAPRLKRSLSFLLIAFVLSILIALPMGVYAATHPRTKVDYGINMFCFAGISLPSFWLGILLIVAFAEILRWLPANSIPFKIEDPSTYRYIILPVASLTLLSLALYTRHTRANMIETLRSDFVRTARAKGCSNTRTLWGHAFRNSMIPVITIMALDFGALFGGALVVERVFALNGMGMLFFDSINNKDYNLIMVCLLITTLAVLLFNFIADMLYAVLDPRIKLNR